jgi:hypothetical protein
MELSNEQALSIIDDLNQIDREVTNWEADRLDDWQKSIEDTGKTLTEGQVAKLLEIKDKYL